ncbi:hypothetical protein FUAX_46070 (plasmid) [Fulvitalea axinellae]|uniref:Alpha-amylase n=1 Tax=Fulvitalea axinellae TaxID=1182444 RepID=A0AAU9DLV4_9BACT|nr:hypothetical protein FUAX_46070 [Fulvitalea axinellae]
MHRYLCLVAVALLALGSCGQKKTETVAEEVKTPFVWENANVYFMLTDRFNNGDKTNDVNFGRTAKTGLLRGFEGGDIKGITTKVKEGYFDKLGVSAIWMTPLVEQVHGNVDEGTGATYGYHGYWAKDWTALDPNFGTEADLDELVKEAHARGIRVLLDVVINHTGPVTDVDPVWSTDWVRETPHCGYSDYESTVSCTLVENLPDVFTANKTEAVELPATLLEKWKKEGRLEQELKSLDEFFARTGLPRAPRYYHIKWLTDYIRKYGVDGFRVDTAKHTEADLWEDLKKESDVAFADWKKANPTSVLDNNEFYMVGEVYGYGISGMRNYHYSDSVVDFFDNGFKSLINFEFKYDAQKQSYEEIFKKYSDALNGELKGKSVMNYLTSHDDGQPFDQDRSKAIESATKLLLTPGASQVYYGDESSRNLVIEGTVGDATLRSFMNWEEIQANAERGGHKVQDVMTHWSKLGNFRKENPAVGAGMHKMLSEQPYIFSREYAKGDYSNKVLVALDVEKGKKIIPVHGVFAEGQKVKDSYSGKTATVRNGKVSLDTQDTIVLLSKGK